jgi:hypothetical protein
MSTVWHANLMQLMQFARKNIWVIYMHMRLTVDGILKIFFKKKKKRRLLTN